MSKSTRDQMMHFRLSDLEVRRLKLAAALAKTTVSGLIRGSLLEAVEAKLRELARDELAAIASLPTTSTETAGEAA